MKELRLQVLGPLLVNGVPAGLDGRARIPIAITAVLALQPQYRHQAFVDAVWPGEEVEVDGQRNKRVQAKVHSALRLVRHRLGVGKALTSHYPIVELSRQPDDDLGVVVTSDADTFKRLRRSPAKADAVAALTLVRGDLAEDLDTDDYQEMWFQARRAEFQKQIETLVTRVAPKANNAMVGELTTRILRGEVRSVLESFQDDTEDRAASDQNTHQFHNHVLIAWLAEKCDVSVGNVRRAVMDSKQRSRPSTAGVEISPVIARSLVASSLRDFYHPFTGDLRLVSFRQGNASPSPLSVVAREQWLNLSVDLLNRSSDTSFLESRPTATGLAIDFDAAINRLATVESAGTRLVNNPLFRLTNIELSPNAICATYNVTDFASYALTIDCLEAELVEALVDARTSAPLPLRQRYLPDLESVGDLSRRMCAGGPVALFAAARPKELSAGEAEDYVVLVQERSKEVLNVTGQLAVIPKAFHQPLVEPPMEVPLVATIRRELEEELMGRVDLDSSAEGWVPMIDPSSLHRLSPPMRWLAERENDGVWRVEIVGFGLNLVSGNYEFATLIVVDDDEWWREFGGVLELGWETSGITRYSTLDKAGLEMLLSDERWSNEGLFSMLCSLQRLSRLNSQRTDIPAVEVTI